MYDIIVGVLSFVFWVAVLRYVWKKRGERKQRELDIEYENMKRAYGEALKEFHSENNTSK